ncbi:hypothetical protein Q0F98_38265 [Paenibacillus amylolyticus]|nr:hypothetical protein Q0F98_38265 [Paenibacillus amylolyticus]
MIIAVVPEGLGICGATEATSGSLLMNVVAFVMSTCASSLFEALATTMSGPLNPLPKPSESRS